MRGSGGGGEVKKESGVFPCHDAFLRLTDDLGLSMEEARNVVIKITDTNLVHAVIDRIEGKYFGAHILADSACSLNLLLMELEEV